MTLFFPDLNVWVALSVRTHRHNLAAWEWMHGLSDDVTLLFSRSTQLGLLRLLTNSAAMVEATLNLEQAWSVYDRWAADRRVYFHPEPAGIEAEFRDITRAFGRQAASKMVGDCYLLAYANQTGAALVTFDAALYALANKRGYAAVMPGSASGEPPATRF